MTTALPAASALRGVVVGFGNGKSLLGRAGVVENPGSFQKDPGFSPYFRKTKAGARLEVKAPACMYPGTRVPDLFIV